MSKSFFEGLFGLNGKEGLFKVGDLLCIAEADGLDLCLHRNLKALHVLLHLTRGEPLQLMRYLVNGRLLYRLLQVERPIILLRGLFICEMLLEVVVVDIVEVHVLDVLHKVRFFLFGLQGLRYGVSLFNQDSPALTYVNLLSFLVLLSGRCLMLLHSEQFLGLPDCAILCDRAFVVDIGLQTTPFFNSVPTFLLVLLLITIIFILIVLGHPVALYLLQGICN